MKKLFMILSLAAFSIVMHAQDQSFDLKEDFAVLDSIVNTDTIVNLVPRVFSNPDGYLTFTHSLVDTISGVTGTTTYSVQCQFNPSGHWTEVASGSTATLPVNTDKGSAVGSTDVTVQTTGRQYRIVYVRAGASGTNSFRSRARYQE